MSTKTLTLPPGTYTFRLEVGEDSMSQTVTLTEETVVTLELVNIGGVYKYTVTGLPEASGYSCTCPDFTKSRSALPDSSYSSEQADADWTASQAGADGDCKHITAVRILRGEVESIPTDVPLPVPKPSKNNPFGKWPKL